MVRTLLLSREEGSPVSAPLRGSSRSSSFALFSLASALYLIVALSVPGAFLIAKQASLLSSSSHLILASEQWGASSDEEDGGEDSWTGPKRFRGALLPKAGIEKIVSLLIAFPLPGAPQIPGEYAQGKLVVAQEVPPLKGNAFPQELLGRSPPSSLS